MDKNKGQIAVATYAPPQQQFNPASAYGGNNPYGAPDSNFSTKEPVFGTRDELDQALAGRQALFIQQELEIFETVANQVGCGCIETENKYSVFDFNTGEKIFYFKESSSLCCRLCCKPYHTANIYAYDVRPTSQNPGQVLLQIYKPFKCGHCPACFDFCQAEATYFLPSSKQVSGPVDVNSTPIFGKAKVPQFGGGFTPTLMTMDRNSMVTSKITGPTCVYGGCLEYCGDQLFLLQTNNNATFTQDGAILKLKPKELDAAIKDAVTDADKFKIVFPATATEDQRATLLGTMILLDYLFFGEFDCHCSNLIIPAQKLVVLFNFILQGARFAICIAAVALFLAILNAKTIMAAVELNS